MPKYQLFSIKKKTKSKATVSGEGNVLARLPFSINLINNVFSPTWYLLQSICGWQKSCQCRAHTQAAFCFPKSILSFLSRIEFFPLHSALPHYIWASVSSRPTGSNILSLRQAKHLLAFLLYLKCIRDKGDICEENLFLFIFTPVISYSRASEECTDTVWLRVSASNLKQLLVCRFFFLQIHQPILIGFQVAD